MKAIFCATLLAGMMTGRAQSNSADTVYQNHLRVKSPTAISLYTNRPELTGLAKEAWVFAGLDNLDEQYKILAHLIEHQIPAQLYVSDAWLAENPGLAEVLRQHPNYDVIPTHFDVNERPMMTILLNMQHPSWLNLSPEATAGLQDLSFHIMAVEVHPWRLRP